MNEENIDKYKFNKRTPEEQREIARKGGIASGEARRKKKAFAEQIELLLSLPFPDIQDRNGKKLKNTFKQLGIDEENIDNQMAIIIVLWQKALKGDIQAFNTLRDTVGEKPVEVVKQTVDGEITTKQKNAVDDVIKQMKPLKEDDT